VDEVGQVCELGLAVLPGLVDGDCAARIEWHSIVHLQIVDVRTEFERVAAKRVCQCILELIRLVPAELRKSGGNANRWQRRLIEGNRWHVGQRTGQRSCGRGKVKADVRIRKTQFVQRPRGKRVVPDTGKRLCRTALLGVKGRQRRRDIEKVGRQG